MTDADDARLGDLYQLRLEADLSSYHWYDCEENRYLLWNRQRALDLLDRIEAQQREIEELRREKDEVIVIAARYEERALKAEMDASLLCQEMADARYKQAASVFAAKHGGRDG